MGTSTVSDSQPQLHIDNRERAIVLYLRRTLETRRLSDDGIVLGAFGGLLMAEYTCVYWTSGC